MGERPAVCLFSGPVGFLPVGLLPGGVPAWWGSSLLGRRCKETAEAANEDPGVSQAEGAPSSDFTLD